MKPVKSASKAIFAVEAVEEERRRETRQSRAERVGGDGLGELRGVDVEDAHQLRPERRDDDEVDGDAELHEGQDGEQPPFGGGQPDLGGGGSLASGWGVGVGGVGW